MTATQPFPPPPPPFPPGDPRLGQWQAGLAPTPPAPWPPAMQPGKARQRNAWILVAIAIVAVAAVALTSGLGTLGRTRLYTGKPLPLPTAAQPTPDSRPLEPAPTKGVDLGGAPLLAVALPKLEAFVEQSRGHRFKHPVTVTSLADKAFLAKLHEGAGPSKAERAAVDAEDATFEALHLIPRHTDLAATLAAQTDQAVGGFYDPATGRLYVRGTTLGPLGQIIVAHELTHALDDQYFDVRALQRRPRGGDEALALRSLLEGDARSVENRFRKALVPAERKKADAEEQAEFGGARTGEPPLFLTLASVFPYEVGAQFVEALRTSGGTAALDAAFANPPLSSLQIIAPAESYLTQGPPPAQLTLAKPTGTVLEQDSLGAFGLAAVLSEKDPRDLLSHDVVIAWHGDRYQTVRHGTRVCVRDTIVAASSGGAAALLKALKAWAAGHPGAGVVRVPGGSTLLLTSCVS